MNDKIKTLAEQAGFILWQNEPWNPGDVIDWSARYDKELKAFAELIVAECAEVCESMPLLGPYKEVQDATLKDAAIQIREHFGVE